MALARPVNPGDRVKWNAVADGTLPSGAVSSAEIEDGAIVNADVASAAAIAVSKMAVASNTVVIGNAAGVGAAVTLSGDVT